MAKSLSIHPLVNEDVAEIVAFIAEDSPEAAAVVAEAIYDQFPLFGIHPALGTLYRTKDPRLDGIRMFPVPRFRNYLIFYAERNDEVRILYVYHGAQDIQKKMGEEPRS